MAEPGERIIGMFEKRNDETISRSIRASDKENLSEQVVSSMPIPSIPSSFSRMS